MGQNGERTHLANKRGVVSDDKAMTQTSESQKGIVISSQAEDEA